MDYRSEIISETPRAYIRRRTLELLRGWLWLIALLMLATGVAACFDSRFLYVLLMEIFIIFPMALGPVWLWESFSPYTRRQVTPHQLTISDSGVLIDYITTEEQRPIETEKIAWSDFESYQDTGKYVILSWRQSDRPPLRIPEYAYAADHWQSVARILAQNL